MSAVLAVAGCIAAQPAHDGIAWRQPAEFEPQKAVWLGADPDDPDFMRVTNEMASALLPHVSVRMLLPDTTTLADGSSTSSTAGTPHGATG